MTNEELVKGLRQNALWVTTHEAADRIEALEREAVLDAKLLADTQGLLDKALEAVIDAKLVAEAKLAGVEKERDEAVKKRLGAERVCDLLDNKRAAAEATVATLTKKMEAMRGAAEEAAEVIHKAYVSATMEAVNAGPSHPLKDNIDKWRVRCLRAEEALRAALTTEKTNG